MIVKAFCFTRAIKNSGFIGDSNGIGKVYHYCLLMLNSTATPTH